MWEGGKKIGENNKKCCPSKPLRQPLRSHFAAPRGLCAAPPLQVPLRCPSRSLGTNFETKIFKFRWFLGPSDQNELYHTPLLPKI